MRRLMSFSLIQTFSFLMIAIASLSACGGGGDSGPGYPDLSYSGIQTEAVIDQDNADEFTEASLAGSSSSTNVPLFGGVTVEEQSATRVPEPKSLNSLSVLIANSVMNQMDSGSAELITGVTERINGSCGGSATLTGNDTGSSFTGSMTFSNFCEPDGLGGTFTMHGKIDFAAEYTGTSESPDISYMSMNIVYLKFIYNDGTTSWSEELSGAVAVNFDALGEPEGFVITINFKFNGKIYKIQNLQLDETTGNIAATLYHPDHGYVDVTTSSPFSYDYVTEQFCGGTLAITGSNGAGGDSVVEFTADATCSTYDICLTVAPNPQECSLSNPWGAEPVW